MLKENFLKKPKKTRIIRSVLLTSLPAVVVAELFFALLYYLIVQWVQGIYFLFSLVSTSQVEANMSIFSVTNIVIFLVALIVVSGLMALEMATIILITLYDWYRNDHIPLQKIIKISYARLRMFFKWSAFPFFLILFFFPKEHIGPKWLLSLKIPSFIWEELFKFPIYSVLIVVAVVSLGYLVYRSLFVLHYALFERTTLLWAFQSSFQLTKKIGIKKMFKVLLQNLFWIIVFVLPIIAIIVMVAQFLETIAVYFGDWVLLLVSILHWLVGFLWVSLPGVLTLSALTIAYIRYAGYHKAYFEKRFPLLSSSRPFEPRWKNIRFAFTKKYPVAIVVILIALSPFFLSIIIDGKSRIQSEVMVISHRGESRGNFIENTISGILEAKKNGADFVEIDVYENKDGTLILSHDANLKRITKQNINISDATDADLEKIVLSNGEKIPTLEEVLKLAKENNISLIIEPKNHGKEKNRNKTLVKLLEKYEMISKVKIHSFSLDTLIKIKKMNPHLQVGQIIFGGFGRFGSTPVDFFSLQETVASRSIIDDIHQYEKKVYIWTVNTDENIEDYMKMGADGFITDEIALVKNRMNEVLEQNSGKTKLVFRVFNMEFIPHDWEKYKQNISQWFQK